LLGDCRGRHDRRLARRLRAPGRLGRRRPRPGRRSHLRHLPAHRPRDRRHPRKSLAGQLPAVPGGGHGDHRHAARGAGRAACARAARTQGGRAGSRGERRARRLTPARGAPWRRGRHDAAVKMPAPDWMIRSATSADVVAVLALWNAADDPPGVTDTPDGLGALLATDRQALLIAESERRVVGSLIAAWDGWRGSFYRLAVHPNRRREGIATALLREGESRLRGRGAVRLTAIVA